jgi:hypothetical protein
VIQVQVLHSKIQVDKTIQLASNAPLRFAPGNHPVVQQTSILLNRLQRPAPVPDLHSQVEDELAGARPSTI